MTLNKSGKTKYNETTARREFHLSFRAEHADKDRDMDTFTTRFLAARKAVIDMSLKDLNPQQRQAAEAAEGPLLILAGAGSGKTTVLIRRIACLLRFGRAADSEEIPPEMTEEDLEFLERYVRFGSPEDRERAEALCALDPAMPWQILAITFTNKAAEELTARLEKLLGTDAGDLWTSTFHSACVRILRRNRDRLGLNGEDFTIYDTADSQSLIKRILKDFAMEEKSYPPRSVLSFISSAKNSMKDPEECRKSAGIDLRRQQLADVYQEYRKRMLQADAMDFDDLLLNAVRLLEKDEEVLDYYRRKFRYILVDEYQDTNMLQYRLVSLLAGERKNLCVVGDDDQGIYKFRGATIQNILEFEEDFPGARVIKLEQNYRSTGTILDAANAVIRHNQGRKGKTLWTSNEKGDAITLYTAGNENEEAQYVASRILASYSAGGSWRDHAVLYRVNALSNRLEYAMKRNGIPYRIYGGTRFYDRAEVKDMLAYLAVIANPGDDLRLRRILNNPPRGIGDTTVERAIQLAAEQGCSLFDLLCRAEEYPELRRGLNGIRSFTGMIRDLREKRTETLDVLYDELLRRSGYVTMLEERDTQENITRLENIQELKTNILSFIRERSGVGTLEDFLDEMALYSDTDEMGKEGDCVSLMTMHSAKGLEFPTVFLVGSEDGLFPSTKAIGEEEELEEERRLCYVAITRAKKKLYITNARQRMVFGRTQNNMLSRFIQDIPEEYLQKLPARENGGGEGFRAFHTEQPSRSASGGSYASRRQEHPRPAPKPLYSAPKSTAAAYVPQVGERVKHKAFGCGTVLTVKPVGPDKMLEIAFDGSGTKKLMLSAAARFLQKE